MSDIAQSFQQLIALHVHVLRGEVRGNDSPPLAGPALSLHASETGWRIDGLARGRRAMLDVLGVIGDSSQSIVPLVPNEIVVDALGRLWGATAPPWTSTDVERAIARGTHGFFRLPREGAPAAEVIDSWTAVALKHERVAASALQACKTWGGGALPSSTPVGDLPRWDPRLDLWPSAEQSSVLTPRVRSVLGHYGDFLAIGDRDPAEVDVEFASAPLHRASELIVEYVQNEAPGSRVGHRLHRLVVGIWDEADEFRKPHRVVQLAENPPATTDTQERAAAAIAVMFVEDALLPGSDAPSVILRILLERNAISGLIRATSISPDLKPEGMTQATASASVNVREMNQEVRELDLDRIKGADVLDPMDALDLALAIAEAPDRGSKVELARLYVEKRDQLHRLDEALAHLRSDQSDQQSRRQIAVADQSVALQLLYDGKEETLWVSLAKVIRAANVDGTYPYAVLSTHRDSALRHNKQGRSGSAARKIAEARDAMARAPKITGDRRQYLETEHQLSLAASAVLISSIEHRLSLTRQAEANRTERSVGIASLSARCASALRWSKHTRELLNELEAEVGHLPHVRAVDGRYLSWSGWHGLTRQMHVRVLLAVVTARNAGILDTRELSDVPAHQGDLESAYVDLLRTEHMTPAVSSNLIRQATWLALLSPGQMIPVVADCNETVPHLLRGDIADLERVPRPSMRMSVAESARWHVDSGDVGTLGRLAEDSAVSRYFDRSTRGAWSDWRTHVHVLQAR